MMKKSKSRRIRVPVRFVDGVWECAFGGAVPVFHGSEADLLVKRSSISDRDFLRAIEHKEIYRILDEGTSLLIYLTIKPDNPPSDDFSSYLKPYSSFRDKIATRYLDNWVAETAAFVEVKLASPDSKQSIRFNSDRGGLWLMTEGFEAVGLATTRVLLPAGIREEPVGSLNHAFTILSEIYETWRISHTGNIYSRVLYQERNGLWYPLEVLRNNLLDTQEQEIAKGLWETFLEKMNLNQLKK